MQWIWNGISINWDEYECTYSFSGEKIHHLHCLYKINKLYKALTPSINNHSKYKTSEHTKSIKAKLRSIFQRRTSNCSKRKQKTKKQKGYWTKRILRSWFLLSVPPYHQQISRNNAPETSKSWITKRHNSRHPWIITQTCERNHTFYLSKYIYFIPAI